MYRGETLVKRLLNALRYDLMLQFRHSFYNVYAIITILYVVVLRLLPLNIRGLALPIVLFSDPGMLGFYFTAAIVLFEKDARSLQAVSVSPLRAGEYVLSKAVSLSVLSVSAALIVAGAVDGVTLRLVPLALSVGLCGAVFVLIGIAMVARHATFSSFILTSVPFTLVIGLPVLQYIGLYNSPFFYLLPSHPALRAIQASLEGQFGVALWSNLAILVLWNIGLYHFTRARFSRHVVGRDMI